MPTARASSLSSQSPKTSAKAASTSSASSFHRIVQHPHQSRPCPVYSRALTRTVAERIAEALEALAAQERVPLPELADTDFILVQDADTALSPTFIASALEAMKPKVGAVGGNFFGEPGGGLLGLLQRIGFHRYAREISRRRYRADVLTGTATLFRVATLRQIRQARLTVARWKAPMPSVCGRSSLLQLGMAPDRGRVLGTSREGMCRCPGCRPGRAPSGRPCHRGMAGP